MQRYLEFLTVTASWVFQWPRLTALFHLDNGVDTDVHENGRYETTFQEPPAEPFYKFYLHPDDIARGRSVSQYSMQAGGGADNSRASKSCNNANVRLFLGTVLLFSLAGVVAVAVTLAVLCESFPSFFFFFFLFFFFFFFFFLGGGGGGGGFYFSFSFSG